MSNSMTTTSQIKDHKEFLAKHCAAKGESPTHTRMGDKDLNVYGGSYLIQKNELPKFHSLYHEHVFTKKLKEHLTEKQLETGVIAVDFDFRYNYDVETRQHSREHIQDMILIYLEELKNLFTFEENNPFDIFIMEKPNVNRIKDDDITKDGIHMLICIQADRTIQMMLRDKILEKLPETWDLPLLNSWESVLDEGISKGTTNWTLYGSRKPGHEVYELTEHFIITYDPADKEFMMDEKKIQEFDFKNEFIKLSVQNETLPKFNLNPKIIELYNSRLENKSKKIKRPNSKTKVNLLIEDDDEESEDRISINDINNKETLEKAVNLFLKSLKPNEYDIRETHEYTQVLPERYYEPGSHLLNRQVAFALKHTDERLFISWILLRSKASDFDYNDIPNKYAEWKKHFNKNSSKDCVTRRSIMYWAKQYNFEGYESVKKNSINYYIEESINSGTEYDLAQVLKQMFKDRYVCVSYNNKGIWYAFKDHRWVMDNGMSLREKISKDMYDLYSNKSDEMSNEYHQYDASDDRTEFIKKKVKVLGDIKFKLKKTNDKNNIMREAMELFYDGEFIGNMDKNKYLMCFNNGVIDFKNKTFRDGCPDDYITKTTKINYIPLDRFTDEDKEIDKDIIEFMKKLFPIQDLERYMWDHLSSCLIGSNKNQTFNVYHGSGSNGKSILADLMSLTLGEYKGMVPITLVTEKRGLIGGTSDEVLKLKGVRYAVMQEPTKGVKLNEGVMKELTGGDPIQARGLYSESEIFEPQFNLVVCTNNLFDIDSNDDGTWRRIRKCDYISKFVDEGEEYNDETTFVFPKDKSLKDKLPRFAPVFASLLVKRVFETDGVVVDCDYVLNSSNKYRKGQDHISAFVAEKIEKTGDINDRVGKNGLYQEFKIWFQQEQGSRKIPKGQELHDFMDKKFGKYIDKKGEKKGWGGIRFIEQQESDIINDME